MIGNIDVFEDFLSPEECDFILNKCKEELFEYCENNGYTHNMIKEQIIYYMNDYSPCLYGISKNNYKKIKRLVAYRIKEKKFIYSKS